jgi:hypothetical protein
MHAPNNRPTAANNRSAQLISSFTHGWLLATGLSLLSSSATSTLHVVSATAPDIA